MNSPLIGITTSRQTHSRGFPVFSIAEAYVHAVSQADGIPVLVPLGVSSNQIHDLVTNLDGILLSGGGDIDPNRFGAVSHPKVSNIDADRDRVEIHLVQEAVRHDKPFLGICRGIQTLNVALGGSLYTDIDDQHPDSIQHTQLTGCPRDYLAHEIQIQSGSQLLDILGESKLKVNSMHHQGIRQLAEGLEATAYAPDGLIEAVEIPGHRFGVAVQWHPEWLTAYAPMRDLFRVFIQVAAS